jgi:acetylornithine deacetylase/succinyl-diaminopimelate desuccinylase-like protein
MAGDWCATEYIAAQFETLGLQPGASDSFFQTVPSTNSAGAPNLSRNVVAIIEGSDPVLRNEVILVAAHHDHLSPDTAPNGTPLHYPGADDNASGVSAVLYAAKILAGDSRPKRTIMFVTFTGEEVMFRGSEHFAEHPPLPLDQITGMLNIDMVGRLHDGALRISGTGTSPEWQPLIERTQGDLPVELTSAPRRGSDHLVFHRRGIPVLYLNTGTHADHHEPSDVWQRVDQQGLARIAEFVARLVGAVASQPSSLTKGWSCQACVAVVRMLESTRMAVLLSRRLLGLQLIPMELDLLRSSSSTEVYLGFRQLDWPSNVRD